MTPEKMTVSAKVGEVEKKWWVIDAEGQTLGRLASQIAMIIRGKTKPIYTPHIECGDFVVVINAEKVAIATRRAEQKIYAHHTGYPGGRREIGYKQMLATHPERIIQIAVRRMLPKNRIGRSIISQLKVYAGPQHPHAAQKPETMTLKYS